jgi:2'-5' RNA ligase
MRLRRRRRERQSAVLVPLPEAGRLLERAGLPEAGVGAAPGMPAHVTVLFPFLSADRCEASGVQAALGAIARGTEPFDVVLAGVGRFPGVLYLRPEPPAPFVALTHAVHARWPDHRPYGGAFPDIVPHLTAVAGTEPDGVAAALERELPMRTRAEVVQLMVEDAGGWRSLATLPMGA